MFASIWGIFFLPLYGKLSETDWVVHVFTSPGFQCGDCRCFLNFTLIMSVVMIGLWLAVRPAENLRHNLDLSVVRIYQTLSVFNL